MTPIFYFTSAISVSWRTFVQNLRKIYLIFLPCPRYLKTKLRCENKQRVASLRQSGSRAIFGWPPVGRSAYWKRKTKLRLGLFGAAIKTKNAEHQANVPHFELSRKRTAARMLASNPGPHHFDPSARPSWRGPGKTAGHLWLFTPISGWDLTLELFHVGSLFNSGFLAWIIAYRSLSATRQLKVDSDRPKFARKPAAAASQNQSKRMCALPFFFFYSWTMRRVHLLFASRALS